MTETGNWRRRLSRDARARSNIHHKASSSVTAGAGAVGVGERAAVVGGDTAVSWPVGENNDKPSFCTHSHRAICGLSEMASWPAIASGVGMPSRPTANALLAGAAIGACEIPIMARCVMPFPGIVRATAGRCWPIREKE